jgi:hypothetical protein
LRGTSDLLQRVALVFARANGSGNGVERHRLHFGDLIGTGADHPPDAVGEPARTVPLSGIVRGSGGGLRRCVRIAIDFAQIMPVMPVVASVARFGARREARDAHRQNRRAEQKPHRTARSTEHAKLIATRGANSQELSPRDGIATMPGGTWLGSPLVVGGVSGSLVAVRSKHRSSYRFPCARQVPPPELPDRRPDATP